jgi:hypothetical protein
VRSVSGFSAFLLVASTSLILMPAAPAHAACIDHNTGDPTLGKVEVCLNDDGTAEASWSTFDESGVHRLYILVGPHYIGICQDYPDPANCTPFPIAT